MVQLKGIDVSKHQGKIDWDKVKADGIQFAMIRLGYGSDVKSQDDEYFEQNVQECERVGIPWGAYLYSYAMTVEDAKSEAAHILRLLKGKKPTYPIAFDMEDADGYKKKRGMPSNKTLVDICYTFLDTVEKAGYYVTIYASKYWFEHILNDPKLDRFDKWVAHWAPKCTYKGKYGMWQFTSTGRVNGIYGPVDMNYAYYDYPNIIKKAGLNSWPKHADPHHEQEKAAAELKKEETYTLITSVDGYYTAQDAKNRVDARTLVARGTYYVFNRKTIDDQEMINITTKKGVPGAWINPADNTTEKKPSPKYYRVEKGDSLWKIAKKHGLTLDQIIKLNPQIKKPDIILPGQKVRIK